MKFFIDTANLTEIKAAASMGVLDGVTTNPSLLAKEGQDPIQQLLAICEIVDGPISAEVLGHTAEEMIREGEALARLHPNIHVKVPICTEGLKAVKHFSLNGIRTNVTLVFSAPQALLAAKAGATIISPFVGRLDDIGGDGMDLIATIVEMFANYDFGTEVLVASVRHPIHVVEAARMGADIATIPFKVIEQLVKHPLTDKGIKQFEDDYRKVFKS